jgi:hypothetical protein
MHHVVRPLASGLNGCQISDGLYAEVDLLPHGCQIFLFPCGKVIEHDHVVPAPYEFIHDMGAYESGTTRD